ncbi:hypothetical protein LEP1GSC060_3557 [Leptospira weilii serovar Ranarum str. ICFT]|uniref:Uncharacterized protein n=1 Tax=Leptospira weilii serovar Ranarum str. ICFT TaxID=1218598 RepID=N1WF64_9LEPT|nr:hypothetical protein LEP1GSC060_3557 [Leptospira weilii serovar Ranarum str. ICFT]
MKRIGFEGKFRNHGICGNSSKSFSRTKVGTPLDLKIYLQSRAESL